MANTEDDESEFNDYLQSKGVSSDTIQKLIQNKLTKINELRAIGNDLDDVCNECGIKGIQKVKLKVALQSADKATLKETTINIQTDKDEEFQLQQNIQTDNGEQNSTDTSTTEGENIENENAKNSSKPIQSEPNKNDNLEIEEIDRKPLEEASIVLTEELYNMFIQSLWRIFIEIFDLINCIVWIYPDFFPILSGQSLYSTAWYFEIISFSIKTICSLLAIMFFIKHRLHYTETFAGFVWYFDAFKYWFVVINASGKIIYSFHKLSSPLTFWLLTFSLSKNAIDALWICTFGPIEEMIDYLEIKDVDLRQNKMLNVAIFTLLLLCIMLMNATLLAFYIMGIEYAFICLGLAWYWFPISSIIDTMCQNDPPIFSIISIIIVCLAFMTNLSVGISLNVKNTDHNETIPDGYTVLSWILYIFCLLAPIIRACVAYFNFDLNGEIIIDNIRYIVFVFLYYWAFIIPLLLSNGYDMCFMLAYLVLICLCYICIIYHYEDGHMDDICQWVACICPWIGAVAAVTLFFFIGKRNWFYFFASIVLLTGMIMVAYIIFATEDYDSIRHAAVGGNCCNLSMIIWFFFSAMWGIDNIISSQLK